MRRNKWLWILILVNIAIASLLVLTIWAMLSLIGIAAYVSGWPLFVLLPVGWALSAIGVVVAKGTSSRVPRGVGFVINGSTLLLHSIVLVGLVAFFASTQRVRFLIPEGYQGDIYVIHSVPDGEAETRAFGRITYRIPADGILRTQAPLERGWTRTTYYYERRYGSLKRIHYIWLTTIPQTPENLADKKDFGVFFPRTGTAQVSSATCPVSYEEFYVGTKAYLLSGYQEKDLLDPYLREHPVKCSDGTN